MPRPSNLHDSKPQSDAPDVEQEGVIKYQLEHRQEHLSSEPRLSELIVWRSLLFDLGLIGESPDRYGGLGYGNVSIRTQPGKFLISASQTGRTRRLSEDQFVRVLNCSASENRIRSIGLHRPSSEAMTHAAAYDAHPEIQCVLHVHHPGIWKNASSLGIPTTPETVSYGSVAMANHVMRILESKPNQVISMKGHTDGIIATSNSPPEAAMMLIKLLALSEAISAKDPLQK